RAERIVNAFGPPSEAGETATLAQGPNAVASAGQDLVRIALVTDIPDEPVGRSVENVMQGDGQLDHPEPRTEMSARHRNGVDHLRPEFVGERLQLPGLEPAKVGRFMHQVEQRRRAGLGQRLSSISAKGRSRVAIQLWR